MRTPPIQRIHQSQTLFRKREQGSGVSAVDRGTLTISARTFNRRTDSGNRGLNEKVAHIQISIKTLAYLTDNLHRQQRVTFQCKEIIINTDPFKPEFTLPQRLNLTLHVTPWGCKGANCR